MTKTIPLTSRPAFGLACGLLCAVIWGVQSVVSRQSVADGLSAGDVTILRFLAASLVMLPFALKRLGFDPASASAPFVATLVDVTGLVIYFGVAALILTGTLL